MARIPDDVRAEVEAHLREGLLSTRQIAERLNISPASVSNIGKAAGIDNGERSGTKRATEVRKVDIAARQAEFAQLLVEDLFRLRDRAWDKQYQVVVVPMKGGGAATEVVEVPTSASDFRNYYTSMGIVVDKIKVLTRDDSDGLAAVDSWLRSLGVGNTQ